MYSGAKKEARMATITVSTDVLREKARIIRRVLHDNKIAHQNLWKQMSSSATTLPSDIYASHVHANNLWNSAMEAHYDHYEQLARAMELAADAYDRGDKNFELFFTPSTK
jgi:uncharacterized protein YukE